MEEPGEILRGGGAQLDPGHGSKLVERQSLPGPRLFDPELRSLVCSLDAVEQLGDMLRVRIGLVQRSCEQRPRQRPLLHASSLGEARQLRRMLGVERDVEPVTAARHTPERTRNSTARAPYDAVDAPSYPRTTEQFRAMLRRRTVPGWKA